MKKKEMITWGVVGAIVIAISCVIFFLKKKVLDYLAKLWLSNIHKGL